MEETPTYKAVRIDDTAYWRLTIYVSRTGMAAFLRNEEDPTEPVVTLFSDTWVRDDESLLRHIETVVYDHPQLLDDFSTDIVICTDHALWVPREMLDEPGSEYELYNKVYTAEEEDISADEFEDMVCLYMLTPGLLPFIRRTLPGARTWCQQTVAVRHLIDRGSDMPRVYADIRAGEADILAFDGRRLLLSATHPWRDRMEIAYHIFNTMSVYGLDPGKTQVSLSGHRDVKTELMKTLREHLKYVMLTMMPSAVSSAEMPFAVASLLSRKQKN